MANMADDIEQFLKQLVQNGGAIEMQRAMLATQFGCAPSQINYVLATRFTPARGYLVESRRGGGGYIRITGINLHRSDALLEMINQQIGTHVAEDEALGYIQRLLEHQIIDEREAAIMQAALRRESIGLELPVRDVIRANLLKAMILAAFRFSSQR